MGQQVLVSRRAPALLSGGLVVWALGSAVAATRSPVDGLLAVAAGFAVLVAVALHRRGATDGPDGADGDELVWRWFSRGVACLAAGYATELALRVIGGDGGPVAGLGLTLGVAVACPIAYQGLIHWNRHRSLVSDPGDWLNGIGAVVSLLALGAMLEVRTGARLDAFAWWDVQGLLLQLSALLLLLGTAVTIVVLGRLHHDARAWVIVAGLGATLVGQAVLGVVRVATQDAAALPAAVGGSGVLWLLLLAALLVASRLPAPYLVRLEAKSEATTVGSLVVLAVSVVTLVSNALDSAPALRGSSVIAVLAIVLSGFRMVRLVTDLSQMALSRLEARTDDLTGVANRRRVTEILAGPPDDDGVDRTLLVVDLARFKDVNDRFGHHAGDEVIRIVAARLDAFVAPRGTVARLGGDEFALVVGSVTIEASRELAKEILGVIAVPIVVDGSRIQLGASIGVASAGLCGDGAEGVMRCAHAALSAAKRTGGGVSVYDEGVDAAARAELALLEDLRDLLLRDGRDAGELVVHYQPQVAAGTREVVGVEALVRWQHPVRGLLPPVAFLDLAERHGLMNHVTTCVLDQAVHEAAGWCTDVGAPRLSVNLSSSCLANPALLGVIDATLLRHGLPASRLIAEVTETSVLEDVTFAVDVTTALAARGIGVSIDDFGTGYSSIARLNALPAEELKLDRSFTMRLTADGRTAAIVAGTIDLAHRLGMRVVAEGVEDEEALHALVALGCDVSQGYLHARPLPSAELRLWLAAQRVRVG